MRGERPDSEQRVRSDNWALSQSRLSISNYCLANLDGPSSEAFVLISRVDPTSSMSFVKCVTHTPPLGMRPIVKG
jgi:hypothetical protein